MAAGLGYFDANGVWRYGESDPTGPLFSDFQNVGQASISTAIGADRTRLTNLELGHLTRAQHDTANTNPRLAMQVGRGMIAGAVALSINEAVTFPVAFSVAPFVLVTFNGVRAGAYDPTGGAGVTASGVSAYGRDVSTTGFAALIERAANMSAGVNYYYTWLAIGQP